MNEIQFTKESFNKFKKIYNKSVKNNQLEFTFENKQFLTMYAKYLIEYVEGSKLL